MLDDEEETDKHFSALPSNSKWLLIPQVISITSGLCNLSSLIFLDKELLCVLHFKIGWKLWKVESQGFTRNFLIISPADNNAFDCVLHTCDLSVLHPIAPFHPARKEELFSLTIPSSTFCAYLSVKQNLRGTSRHRVKTNLCSVMQNSLIPPNLISSPGCSGKVLLLHNQKSLWRADIHLSLYGRTVHYH